MSESLEERLEKARRAVRGAYGEDTAMPPGESPAAVGAVAAAGGPDGRAPLRELLARSRHLAHGRPAAAEARPSWWRRLLRAVGARLIRFESAWQHKYNELAVASGEAMAAELERLAHALAESRSLLQALQGEMGQVRQAGQVSLEQALQQAEARTQQSQADQGRERQATEERLGARLDELAAQAGDAVTAAKNASSRTSSLASNVDAELKRFRQEVGRIMAAGESIRHSLIDAARRDAGFESRLGGKKGLEAQTSRVRASLTELETGVEELRHQVSRAGAEEIIDLDAVAFAARFRGSEVEIRGRLQRYVDLFRLAGSEKPLLEIGCGRGEFLDLCRDAGLIAAGLDRDAALVKRCVTAGLVAEVGDFRDLLPPLPAASVGGVLAVQVMEHLPPGDVQILVRQAHRLLVPGGLLILETLNPACLSVLATTFYRDPTHRRPYHPDTTVFILESAGFTDVRAITQSPVPASERLSLRQPAMPAYSFGEPGYVAAESSEVSALRQAVDRELARLNDLLFADQEYHVMGRKP